MDAPDPSTVTTLMTHSDPYSGVDLELGPDGNLYYASIFTEDEGNEFAPGRSTGSSTSPATSRRSRG